MSHQYKARTWQTLDVFDEPIAAGMIITVLSTNYRVPEGLSEKVKASWDKQIADKKAQLEVSGDGPFEVRTYRDTGLTALYFGDKPKMWPGTAVTLTNWERSDSSMKLYLGRTSFPMINAVKDANVITLYESQGIPVPRPSLAVCTMTRSLDNKLILTVRGPRTNMYPDRVYGQGGNPVDLFDPTEHQADEMRDEILVIPAEYDASAMEFLGLVEDNEGLPRKPDLVGWVPVNLESGEVVERVRKRHDVGKSPNDAVAVELIEATDAGLIDYLARKQPEHFCPPALGNLVLYGDSRFEGFSRELQKLVSWMTEVTD